ncbi:hypothetical protein KP509_02G110700 [Ceratopteris richardii]|uniref:FLZ-type domain-containing protein n=1 Tax=Ceratopteris richardii TaxID=49495 RepID=A0A8T2VHV0_CERRI|nr:hypothetical protein KP509_02G110700 [Ceratopteris richardii]
MSVQQKKPVGGLDSPFRNRPDSAMCPSNECIFGPMKPASLSWKRQSLFVQLEDAPMNAMAFRHEAEAFSPSNYVAGKKLKGYFINCDTITKEKNEDGSIRGTAPPISVHNDELIRALRSTGLTKSLLRTSGCSQTYNAPINTGVHRQSNLETMKGCVYSMSSATPALHRHSEAKPFLAFLEKCCFCGRSLHLEEDIYMYRGDQSFCSTECRYQKISLDARKAKCSRKYVIQSN